MLQQAVFRVVQEALNNVRKHGRVKKAQVRLCETGSRFRLYIRDRGVGFETETIADDRFGLRGIRERTQLFHGRAVIRSRPGRGTLVFAEFPT